jgi:hypothetical protein
MPSALYQTEVARTREAVEALREAWKAMPSRVDADIDFFLRFVEVHRDFVVRPHVIVLREGSRIVSILPGRLERQSPGVKIGYKEVPLPTVNQITFVGQLLGEDSKETAAEVMKSAEAALRQREADVALFHQVDFLESLREAIEKAGGVLTKDYFEKSEENWTTRIPSDYETFLKDRSSNTRYNIKRYSKRLLQAFPEKVQYNVFQDVNEIEAIFRDCEAVAAKSYHRGLGVGFFDNEATRRLFTLAAARGWLRTYILYINGQATAFWNGFLYRGTFLIWDTAYDSDVSDLRPGLYLLQKLIKDLCASGLVHELDFGTGSAQYKTDMCDRSGRRVSRFLFAPTLTGVSINVLRTPPLAFGLAAKWVLTRFGLFRKLKKVWRSRLAATSRQISTVESHHD